MFNQAFRITMHSVNYTFLTLLHYAELCALSFLLVRSLFGHNGTNLHYNYYHYCH